MTPWADVSDYLARQGKVPQFLIRIDGGGWVEATKAGYIAAEKEAGLRDDAGPDEPQHYAFTATFTRGYGSDAVSLPVEGKVVL